MSPLGYVNESGNLSNPAPRCGHHHPPKCCTPWCMDRLRGQRIEQSGSSTKREETTNAPTAPRGPGSIASSHAVSLSATSVHALDAVRRDEKRSNQELSPVDARGETARRRPSSPCTVALPGESHRRAGVSHRAAGGGRLRPGRAWRSGGYTPEEIAPETTGGGSRISFRAPLVESCHVADDRIGRAMDHVHRVTPARVGERRRRRNAREVRTKSERDGEIPDPYLRHHQS